MQGVASRYTPFGLPAVRCWKWQLCFLCLSVPPVYFYSISYIKSRLKSDLIPWPGIPWYFSCIIFFFFFFGLALQESAFCSSGPSHWVSKLNASKMTGRPYRVCMTQNSRSCDCSLLFVLAMPGPKSTAPIRLSQLQLHCLQQQLLSCTGFIPDSSSPLPKLSLLTSRHGADKGGLAYYGICHLAYGNMSY